LENTKYLLRINQSLPTGPQFDDFVSESHDEGNWYMLDIDSVILEENRNSGFMIDEEIVNVKTRENT
jgi:hypothetical protein